MENKEVNNMDIYAAVRAVPAGAVKAIEGGSYGAAGLSDINPQWRIECMTQLFGPVGIGWTWEPVEMAERNGVLFGHIIVRYRDPVSGEMSEPVHGYGGTKFGGRDDSDIYKSTITDAISNALRYLGVGADVWYSPKKTAKENQFDTKYSAPMPRAEAEKPKPQPKQKPAAETKPAPQVETISTKQAAEIRGMVNEAEWQALEGKYGKGLGLMSTTVYPKIVEKLEIRRELLADVHDYAE